MTTINWSQLWQQSKSDVYDHAVMALLLLNGVQLSQLENLPDAKIYLDSGWISMADGNTYPLVSYAIDALTDLYDAEASLSTERIQAAIQKYEALETDALRRLAGAIWISDEELQLTLATTGTHETPILPLRFTFPFSVSERLQANEVSAVAIRGREVLQHAADWLVEQSLASDVTFVHRVISLLRQGSLVFLVTSTGVSALNLVHNVLMGRLLNPADYSQLTFIITLQLLVGLLPTALQTVVARFTARYHAHNDTSLLGILYQQVARFGWLAGLLLSVIMFILSPLLVSLFQLDGVGLVLPVVLAMTFFVQMGAGRGLLQGLGSYFWLSGAYLAEGVIRLVIGVVLGYALLEAGRSLEGAIWGIAQSMVITWFISWLAIRHFQEEPEADNIIDISMDRAEWLHLGWITALVLIGQMLITNSDFLLVKNFFSPEDAGLYAAISVLGRIVYFGALPLTILLVPLVARRQALNEPTRPILMLLIGGGTVVCGMLVLIAALFSSTVLNLLYGEEYVAAASLLAPYALAASLYTLTNLVITYQIALGQGNETWMPILAGTAQIIGVFLFHGSLGQVITIQIVLMAILFSAVAWQVLRPQTSQKDPLLLMAEGGS